MESLIDALTRGNPTEVKVVLASVVLALAAYQIALITVVYGKLRPRFLGSPAAATAHRAVGRAIVLISVIVAIICVSYFEIGEAVAHSLFAVALFLVIGLKVLVIRRWRAASRFLPLLGVSVLLLFAATWLTSAGDFLADS
jgi:hypothetical protein